MSIATPPRSSTRCCATSATVRTPGSRDLVDLVILIEHGMLDPACVAAAARQVFSERDAVEPPAVLPPLPESWPDRFERLVADHDLETQLFPAGVVLVQRLWAEMFPMQESHRSS